MSAISLRKVKKAYGKNEVVHGVDFEAATGEFVVVLGPSGCGKSTLLRMVAGLEAVTSGEIEIGGRVVNTLEPRERGCAMVFQNYALYPHMSVADNIGYSLKVAGVPRNTRETRVKAVAESLGLGEFLRRKPGQLSGGQRQRVAMGRAMIREPKVFLYDEPLSNLDAKLRVAMRVEIRRLHQKLGTTTLFVTHDQVEAMTLADRIVVMNKGVIEQVGTPADVYHRPQSTYVASFIGAPGMNILPARRGAGSSLLVFADGQTLDLGDRSGGSALPDEVHVGIRAESINLAENGKGVRAKVHFTEELGSSRLLHAEIGSSQVVVSSKDAGAVEAGAEVLLDLAPGALHFFHPESGRRISH
ncbi:MAG: sn-glycerol-3-phosphate ABC transporter ATP-binding protein UgpC [Aestuariivirga sp.]|uniref:sn-glycerol-3-phosphate ABC transporter ATP-binding protein UgpC n=1 Tax=Aestuariivirga sp. TaxID=2650926 RepID=UPI00301A8BF2